MKILCITHADFETPGVIEDWAKIKGHGFEIKRPYRGDVLPDIDTYDFLIVMGGPQSPLKLHESPYLSNEISLIKKAIEQNKKVIGFCLGAQLIGEACGAQTERSPEKEVGVFPITLNPEARNDPLLKDFPETVSVIHWHNDMPGLTQNAVILAHSQGCPRQVVRYNSRTYGFQCHLEMTLEDIRGMVQAVAADLTPQARYVQSADELFAQDYAPINAMMLKILDRLVELS